MPVSHMRLARSSAPEPALASFSLAKGVDLDDFRRLEAGEYELRDTLSARQRHRVCAEVLHDDTDLTSIIRIDRAGAVG